MPTLPTIREHMDRFIYTVSPEMSVLDAIDVLLEHRVTGVPVVTGDGEVVGILTEGECLKLIAKGTSTQPPKGTVADVMVEAHQVPPTMDLYYAAGIMLRTNYRRLIAVEDGRLVGAITRRDILRVLRERLRQEVGEG